MSYPSVFTLLDEALKITLLKILQVVKSIAIARNNVEKDHADR